MNKVLFKGQTFIFPAEIVGTTPDIYGGLSVLTTNGKFKIIDSTVGAYCTADSEV